MLYQLSLIQGGRNLMNYLWSFLLGGVICGIGQVFMDKFKILPAYILVLLVSLGNVLALFPGYDFLVKHASGGACIPILGFGYSLGKSVIEKVDEMGFLGIISGGLMGVSAGIAFSIFISFILSFIFTSKTKSLK